MIQTEDLPKTDKEYLEKIDNDFLLKALKPYSSKEAVYLQEASVLGKLGSDSNYIVQGKFSIESPCYVDETGHFNAVEFVMCYNQIGAVSLAYATQNKLLLCLEDLTVE